MTLEDATIGPARPEDAAAMGKVLSDWIDTTPWMPRLHSFEEDRRFCAGLIATQQVLVARGPGVEGFLSCDGLCVTCLYLAQGARGRGLGARLMDAAKAGRDRLVVWTFAANPGAIRFYQREGFRIIATTEGDGNEEGMPDVQLEWQRERADG